MTCERCGGDSGPYRKHADPHECVVQLQTELDRLDAMRCETCKFGLVSHYGGPIDWCSNGAKGCASCGGGCRAWEGRDGN
jgi:hypothetical protein